MRAKARKPRSGTKNVEVDATRLAVASLERVLSVFSRTGKKPAAPSRAADITERERMLRRALPPSYRVVIERAAGLGAEAGLLDGDRIARAKKKVDNDSFIPFAEGRDGELYCFDRKAEGKEGELPVYLWLRGEARPHSATFAQWLDGVADRIEEGVASAAEVPASLRSLLVQLGFSFDDPIVGRLETGDVAAIEELVGPDLAREVRGKHQRLFDSSGKASLVLNLDEFSLAASLRTGIYMFSAEEVFRWLRYFRDESFYGEAKHPSHADRTRDLRRAPREPPLVLRGVLTVSTLQSNRYTFRAASGLSRRDFYLLGRTAQAVHGSSLLLHVVGGVVQSAHAIDEPLSDIHVAQDGAIWGLVPAGSAIRFQAGGVKAFPLRRATKGRAWFYGIASAGGRVVAYGAGTLLQFDGSAFVPFQPDAQLEPTESIVSLVFSARELSMLVCGEQVGAVARFDGRRWLPIEETDVIDGGPIHLDVWRQVAVVLGKDGRIHRVERGAPPRPVVWDTVQDAFHTQTGTPRPLHQICGVDGGAMLATDGGAVVVGSGDPVFYSAPGRTDRAYISRVGAGGVGDESAIAVMCGPNVWLWENGALTVLDLRAW
jgi:hypothetical protein